MQVLKHKHKLRRMPDMMRVLIFTACENSHKK